jgi:hypothetical protein
MTPEQQQKIILSRLVDGPGSPDDLRREAGGISPATLSRLMGKLGSKIIALGKARATRYARSRDIRGIGEKFPVYQIDAEGNAHQTGLLLALWGGHFWWESTIASQSRLFRNLPWFIQDMRPDGFVGRAFAHKTASELGLPIRLSDWNDDDVVVALARRGEECMGNQLVGDESLERYLRKAHEPIKKPCSPDDYVELARQAMDGDPAGSSAGGEQPKFTTLIERDGGPMQVLVKFSPKITTEEGQRWADLLVCEHLALEIVREAGFAAASSRLHSLGERKFLEVERFDRRGQTGRLPMNSLGAVDDEFFGRRDNWIAMAGRLQSARMLSDNDAAALTWLSVFGSMIANTDQHFGNISLIPQDERREKFLLAPAYDMLPMLYRPREGEATFPEFVPPMPFSGSFSCFDHARKYTLIFWERAAADGRISEEFRRVCGKNRDVLEGADVERIVG